MRIPAVDALNIGLIANGQLGITSIPCCENHILYYLCNFRLYRLLTNENTCSGCFKHGANS
jgi:hypothetical protein